MENAFIKLEEMRQRHNRDIGVMWRFDRHGDRAIMFSCFCNLSRIKGNGAKALRELCEFADECGLTIRLWTIYPRLYSYYEAFGFVHIPDMTLPAYKRHETFRSYARPPEAMVEAA